MTPEPNIAPLTPAEAGAQAETTTPPSPADLLACARRELAMRRKVYPRQVALGRMKQSDADRETAHMAAIVTLLEAAAPLIAAFRGPQFMTLTSAPAAASGLRRHSVEFTFVGPSDEPTARDQARTLHDAFATLAKHLNTPSAAGTDGASLPEEP